MLNSEWLSGRRGCAGMWVCGAAVRVSRFVNMQCRVRVNGGLFLIFRDCSLVSPIRYFPDKVPINTYNADTPENSMAAMQKAFDVHPPVLHNSDLISNSCSTQRLELRSFLMPKM